MRATTDADAERWDDFVLSHPSGTPYHRWAWKQALEKGYGLQTAYYLSEDENGELRGALPCAKVRHPFGDGPLCALPYCDRGEPLATDSTSKQELITVAVTDHGSALEVRASCERGSDDPHIQDGQKVSMLLALPDSSEALSAGFKSKLRSQINKANKNGLMADIASGQQRIDDFYPVYAHNMRDLGSPAHSKAWFTAVADAFGQDCLVALVKKEQTVVGAAIVLLCKDRAVIPWASTLRDYNRLAPNMLLYWTVLAHLADSGCRQFDFGRSSFGEGTFRFKSQWGAQPRPLVWTRYQQDQSRIQATIQGNHSSSALRAAAEACWRRCPVPLATAVGSRIRPWLSL